MKNYMRATDYRGFEADGYYMSEKYDGVRVKWNGEDFLTCSGENVINVPRELRAGMPQDVCEGEFFHGRGQFYEMNALIQRKRSHYSEWRKVLFMLFDAPEHGGIWEHRQQLIRSLNLPYWVRVVDQRRVECRNQLLLFYSGLLENKAEGVVLAKAGGYYEIGKSDNLLRLKTTTRESFRVVGYTKHRKQPALVGALICEMPDGRTFRVGTGLSYLDRINPPALDTYIHVDFRGTTNKGKPRHASWIRDDSDAPTFLSLRD